MMCRFTGWCIVFKLGFVACLVAFVLEFGGDPGGEYGEEYHSGGGEGDG